MTFVSREEREKGEVVLRYTLVLSRTHFNERREFCKKQLETFFLESVFNALYYSGN